MTQELTGELYLEFLGYFAKEFPAIRTKFPDKIEWSLKQSPYCTTKPPNMQQEDFDEFRRIELEWFIDNNITEQYEGEAIFVNVIHGQTTIPHNRVLRVIELTDNSHSIICEDNKENEVEYSVVGNIGYINKKLNRI